MKPAPFVYHQALSVDHVTHLLAEFAPQGGRILAGGQSLVPIMAFRLAQPAHLIDINRLPGLNYVTVADRALCIGALARHAAFHQIVCDGPTGDLLREMAGYIAHYPIRIRGTFCGSLAHADPSSEWCLALVTLGGSLMACAAGRTRSLAAADFFRGVMATALHEDEMLVETRLDLLSDDARFGFYEHSRRAGDYALSMSLVIFSLRAGRMCDVRLGIGGAEINPRRLPQAEAVLEAAAPSEAVFAHAAEQAAACVVAMEDGQMSATLRREMVRATTLRALRRAAAGGIK